MKRLSDQFSFNNAGRILALFSFFTPFFCHSESGSEKREVTIGVVKDGDSWFFDALGGAVESELRVLTEDKYRIEFKREPSFNANWDSARIEEVLRNALRDPEVDLVLAQGVLVMRAASEMDFELSKPVSGAHLQDPDVVGVLLGPDGRTTKRNLNLVVSNNTIINDIRAFKTLVDFDRLHVLASLHYISPSTGLESYIGRVEEELGIEVVLIPMSEDAEDTLDHLPFQVEAIYGFPPVRMNAEEREKLINGLIGRGIPSFAYFGEPGVEAGILAGLLPDVRQQLARRVALNIQQIIVGASPNELPAMLPVEERLYFNARTASLMGFDPPFEAIRDAIILNAEYLEGGDSLNMQTAVDQALETNFDYLIQQQNTVVAREGKRIALGPLLPQVVTSYAHVGIDKDRAGASGGNLAQRKDLGGVSLQQLIFSDAAISNLRVFRELYKGSTF